MVSNLRTHDDGNADKTFMEIFLLALKSARNENSLDNPAVEKLGIQLEQTDSFKHMHPATQDCMRALLVLFDSNQTPEAKVAAAQRVDETRHVGGRDLDAAEVARREHFLGKIFEGISADGNLENDKDTIIAIKKALNGLQVDGQTITMDTSNGDTTNKLGALLQNADVVLAIKAQIDAGVINGVSLKEDAVHRAEEIHSQHHLPKVAKGQSTSFTI